MNGKGSQIEWERFLLSTTCAQKDRVKRDIEIGLAIGEQDYVTAIELATTVAFGDAKETRRTRRSRENEDLLFSLFHKDEEQEHIKQTNGSNRQPVSDISQEPPQLDANSEVYWKLFKKPLRDPEATGLQETQYTSLDDSEIILS